MMRDGRIENFSEKEKKELRQKFANLNRNLGGIRSMKRVPNAVFVVDAVEEKAAVREANKLGIPVVGIVGTNCDPTLVSHPIPGNNDAVRSISLFTRAIADAIIRGRQKVDEVSYQIESIHDKTSDMESEMDEPSLGSSIDNLFAGKKRDARRKR